jgi:hypothetical protein
MSNGRYSVDGGIIDKCFLKCPFLEILDIVSSNGLYFIENLVQLKFKELATKLIQRRILNGRIKIETGFTLIQYRIYHVIS